MAIAAGMRAAGRGVFEVASDYHAGSVDVEFARYRSFSEVSGRPVSIPVLQDHGDPDGWRTVLSHIEQAAAAGLPLSTQTAVRPVGVAMGLESRSHLWSDCAGYMEIAHLPLPDRVARMSEPSVRARILAEARQVPPRFALAQLYAMTDPVDYEPEPSTSIAARAEALDLDPLVLAYDTLLGDVGQSYLWAPVRNFADGTCRVVRELLCSPLAVPGLGDGGAHCTQICDMSFPTTLLCHWGRDRRPGRLLPLASLVREQSYETARLYGLSDRGQLLPGLKADLNLIDFDRLKVRPPRMACDFPAGGKRLVQHAEGYRVTIVSGAVTFEDGEHTGALPGRLARAGRCQPSSHSG
jgi:N-acyl-D-aspartate/D-glutamate deacylase